MSSPKNNSRPGLSPISTSRAPPLAGRPPFATDDDYDDNEPASFYETPRAPMTPSRVQFSVPQTPMTPTQRIRAQMILPAATANTAEREKRTSAYDVYDDYISASASTSTSKPSSSTSRTLTPTKPTNPFSTPLDSPSHAASSSSSPPSTSTKPSANRASGIGALLLNMSDSDSEFDSDDDDDDDDARRAEVKRGTMTKNTLVGAGASNNKNAALAAAVGGGGGGVAAGKVTFALPANAPPVPAVQQQQQPPRQPESPPRQQQQGQGQPPMRIAAPQPGYAAPIAAFNLGAGNNPFEPAQQSRNPFTQPGPSMPQPQNAQRPEMAQIPNANGRAIPMPAPLRIKPPPANLQIQTTGINPFDQPATPYTPYTPFTPHSQNKPQTPHPLLPPVTPITPAFIRPAKSMSMSSGGSGGSGGGPGAKAIPPPAAITFDERMVVPMKGGGGAGGGATPRPRNPTQAQGRAGDEFWRRFSMVARKDGSPGGKERSGGAAARPSSWLATSRASNSRYTRTVWVVGMLLVFGIIAGVGCGVYFTRGSPAHQLPKTIGGSADQAATYSTTATGVGGGGGLKTSTSLHVSPTRVVAREEAVQTGVPVLDVVQVSPSPRHVHHLRMFEKREW